jgi:hypothetical protein
MREEKTHHLLCILSLVHPHCAPATKYQTKKALKEIMEFFVSWVTLLFFYL